MTSTAIPSPKGETLKPCPFCGGCNISKMKGRRANGEPWPYIRCDDCDAVAEPDIWNRRSTSSSEDVRREALEEAAKVAEEYAERKREEISDNKGFDHSSYGAGWEAGALAAAGEIEGDIRALSQKE